MWYLFLCECLCHILLYMQVEVPTKMAGIIIGVKGQNVRRIEAKTGVSKLKLVDGPNEVWLQQMQKIVIGAHWYWNGPICLCNWLARLSVQLLLYCVTENYVYILC